MHMKQSRQYYSKEFKIKAVELSNQRGNMTSVAKELGIKRDSLKRWKESYSSGKLLPGSVTDPGKAKHDEELSRLKKELYEVKLERDILKKAVSIFSKSDR